MARHLALAAWLAGAAAAQGAGDPTLAASRGFNRNPAENVEMLTVKIYKGGRGCEDERFLRKSFQPIAQCMPVERDRADAMGLPGPAFVKGALGELGGGQKGYMEQFYSEDTCARPLFSGPNATVTNECAYDRTNDEWKIGVLDGAVATVYLERFSSPGCEPESMTHGQYWGLDACMPKPEGDEGWGKHTSLPPGKYESLMWWVTRGNAEVFFFKSRDCSGRADVAEDGSAMRAGGGVCAQFPRTDADYPGYYKAWTFKRQYPKDFRERNSGPECVWLARDIAERIGAIEHPDKTCEAKDTMIRFDQDLA